MIITTSRYSSKTTREFARLFADLLNSKYKARGKKKIDDFAKQMPFLGESILCIIEEKDSNPYSIQFISADAVSNWRWSSKEFIILAHNIKREEQMKSSIKFQCNFKSEKDCLAASDSIKSEEEFKGRATTKINKDSNNLEITIEADDLVALRATMNALFRYLHVIDNINGGNIDEE
ncbi:hypothetical protein HYT84_04955 [Candidatus Micrarchaeota archaeon]|nr:hypothetical protein [Candidatus Micrarchaeota archaeon]